MKLKALWIPLVFIRALSADTYTCNAGVASAIPVFSTASASGEVDDYTLDCTGPASPAGEPVPVIDVDAFLNVPILNTGGWTLADGGTPITGTLEASNVVEFEGVPFGFTSGSESFTIEGLSVNPSEEGPGFEFQEIDEITFTTAVMINNSEQEVGVNATPEPSVLWIAALCLGVMCVARRARIA
jgi:hypothetical protein